MNHKINHFLRFPTLSYMKTLKIKQMIIYMQVKYNRPMDPKELRSQ